MFTSKIESNSPIYPLSARDIIEDTNHCGNLFESNEGKIYRNFYEGLGCISDHFLDIIVDDDIQGLTFRPFIGTITISVEKT